MIAAALFLFFACPAGVWIAAAEVGDNELSSWKQGDD